MNNLTKASLAFLVCLFLIPAYAFDGITYYSTTITNRDRYNSMGDRLYSVRDILRQDRANMHRFGIADRGDQYDSYFSRSSRRNLFNHARLIISPRLARRIKQGGRVRIKVWVYPGEIEVTR